MKTEIKNLENKINDLIIRVNNADGTLKENQTNEIQSLREGLQKVVDEFYLLASKVENENSDKNSDVKITIELADELASLIVTFVSNNCFNPRYLGSRNVNDVELSINYDQEIELERATIDVEDYFVENFSFDFDKLIEFTETYSNGVFAELKKYLTTDLFNIIADVLIVQVRDIDTSVQIDRFEDFEVDLDHYKRLEVTEVTINGDELQEIFSQEFDFGENEYQLLIYNYYNLSEEDEASEEDEVTEVDFEDNSSEVDSSKDFLR